LENRRLFFGYNKYAALNLVVAKWIKMFAPSQSYRYITLGGTELQDVANIAWVDNQLTSQVISYEQDPKKHKVATGVATRFKQQGINVDVVRDDIFSYRRGASDAAHIFFLDCLGVCSPDPYTREFKIWFENDVIRPGDLILITSYLGRNPGWQRVLRQYDPEFRILRINSFEQQKQLYEIVHPLFVLLRAVIDAGLKQELALQCFGSVKYRDSSTMGVYGIICQEKTNDRGSLASMLTNTAYFNTMTNDWNTL